MSPHHPQSKARSDPDPRSFPTSLAESIHPYRFLLQIRSLYHLNSSPTRTPWGVINCASALCKRSMILFVADLFEPFDDFAVEGLLDGDVGHGGGRGGAVPVAFVGRAPDDVAGADLDLGLPLALYPAAALGDDQRLAERM